MLPLSAVFNRCAESMEEGRRLENLSWRLWNRETFCCESRPQFPDTPTSETPRPLSQSKKDVPELSTSAETVASEDYEQSPPNRSYTPPVPIQRLNSSKASADSLSSSRGRGKPISSQALQNMVMSIQETKITQKHDMTGLSTSITEVVPSVRTPQIQQPPHPSKPNTTSTQATEQTSPRRQSDQRASQSSTSTAPLSSPESRMERSGTYDSQTSAELIAPASVVRGFGPHTVSSSQRLHAPVVAAPPKQQPMPAPVPIKPALRTTQATQSTGFRLGGSPSDESSVDDTSLQTRQSSLTAALRQSKLSEKKTTSFKEVVESHTIAHGSAAGDEDAIASDDEEDDDEDREEEEDDMSESAIEDEEDSSDWEDSVTDSGQASPRDQQLFQRVDSKPNLVSRRSLLTTALHQGDRAAGLASAAARSQPTLRRSRPSATTGLSVATTPSDDEDDDEADGDDESALEIPADQPSRSATRARPIIKTTTNTHQPALSPRTTRRNMLASELTESLRKHLLHERQQKTTTASAAIKRRHTAHDVTTLKNFPGEPERNRHGYPAAAVPSGATSKTNSWNAYVDHGEYNSRGW